MIRRGFSGVSYPWRFNTLTPLHSLSVSLIDFHIMTRLFRVLQVGLPSEPKPVPDPVRTR